ncbi:MAG: hypothetical protein JRF63_14405, partial [Deltaproteobacteria bacterium]|nr:hypothetical protein [Deltaproteobacteria bacterium]
MRTVWGIIALMLVAAFVAAGCGTKKDDGDAKKVEPDRRAAPGMAVKADDVTSKRGRTPEASPKPEPAALPTAEVPPKPEAKADPPTQDADEPTLVKTDGLMLSSIVLARGIEKRKAVDPGTSFKAEKGVFLYTIVDVLNPEREATSIK